MLLHSLEDTERLAKEVALRIEAPDVIALEGIVGAGKTTFTKALVAALGVTEMVNSPTFTILKQYEGDLPIQHFDVYRLKDQVEDLGWDDLFYNEAVSIVEWAHYIREVLPEHYLQLTFTYVDETTRRVTCQGVGERFEKMCEVIEDAMARN